MDLNTSLGYDRLWWMEDDVRVAGSWSQVYNNIHASLALHRNGSSPDVVSFQKVHVGDIHDERAVRCELFATPAQMSNGGFNFGHVMISLLHSLY